jgi:hypothetical protein
MSRPLRATGTKADDCPETDTLEDLESTWVKGLVTVPESDRKVE